MEQNQQMAGIKLIRRWLKEGIQRYLNKQEQSGLTIKEYCEICDIVEQTFYIDVYPDSLPEDVEHFDAIETEQLEHDPANFLLYWLQTVREEISRLTTP